MVSEYLVLSKDEGLINGMVQYSERLAVDAPKRLVLTELTKKSLVCSAEYKTNVDVYSLDAK